MRDHRFTVDITWTGNEEAHRFCFIANSVKFEVEVEPEVTAAPE